MKVRNLIDGEFPAGEVLELTYSDLSSTAILTSSTKSLILVGASFNIPLTESVDANLIELDGVKELAAGGIIRTSVSLEPVSP